MRSTKLGLLRKRLDPYLAYLQKLCADVPALGELERKLKYPYARLLIKVYVIRFCLKSMWEGACLRWAVHQARQILPENTLSESTGYRWVKEYLHDAEVGADEKGNQVVTNVPFSWDANGGGKAPSIFILDMDLRDEAIKWVRDKRVQKGQKNMTAEQFKDYVNGVLFPKYGIGKTAHWDGVELWEMPNPNYDPTSEGPNPNNPEKLFVKHPKISYTYRTFGLTCATEVLHGLGFTYCAAQGGIFSDEHDKDENVKYREETFHPLLWGVYDRSHLFVSLSWLARRENWHASHPAYQWDMYMDFLADVDKSKENKEEVQLFMKALLASKIEDLGKERPPYLVPAALGGGQIVDLKELHPQGFGCIPHPYNPAFGTHLDRFEWVSRGTMGHKLKEEQRSLCVDRFAEFGKMGGCLRHDYVFVHGEKKPYVILVQDETIVRLHDSQKTAWGDKKHKLIRHKHPGKGLMFSGFATEAGGFPVLDAADPTIPEDLKDMCTQLAEDKGSVAKLGKSELSRMVALEELDYSVDGHWNCERMLGQTVDVVKVAKHLYPEYNLALLYDASSGHHKFDDDALVATRMRKAPGGKQPIMRETRIPQDELPDEHALDPVVDADGNMLMDDRGIYLFRQSMVFEEGDFVLATGESSLVEMIQDQQTGEQVERHLSLIGQPKGSTIYVCMCVGM